MAKTLLMTVGLPRSGKSTWAFSSVIPQGAKFPVVNPDSVRLALHGQAFIPETEKMVWVVSYYMVRALFLAGHDTVILDGTQISRKRREEWKSPHWVRKFKIFDTTAEECIRRARAGGREDLVPVIERMAGEYDPVEPEEWNDKME